MLLQLPELVQENDWSCGRTCFEIATRYLGAKGKKPDADPLHGTDPISLERALRNCGLDVRSGNMDVNELRFHTQAGRPVVCLVTEGEGVHACGHWVVVSGVAYRYVHFVCPTHGAVKQSVPEFEARWRDDDRMGVRLERWGIAVG